MVTLEKHVSRQKMSVYLGEDSSTPLELAQEMVSKIPLEILKDPERRFLDPCAGTGTFLIALFHELKKYHSEDHILSNMLYACEVDKFKLRILKNLGVRNIYEESYFEGEFDMKDLIIIGNPPFTIGGAVNGKGGKSALPAFLSKAMESAEIVMFVCPAHFALSHAGNKKVWRDLNESMEKFGLENLTKIDQKRLFPDVSFDNAAYIHLQKGSTRLMSDFHDLFGGFKRPDTTDVERISTQRGASIGKSSPLLQEQGPFRIITSVSNDGSNTIRIAHLEKPTSIIKSPWAVVVQEQSGLGIRDAVVVDNTKGDLGVTANAYALHCQTEEEACKLAEWVTTDKFNSLLKIANNSHRVLKVSTLQLCPSKPIYD